MQPISFAFLFIKFANASWDPETCSAKITALSFADCNINAYSKSFTESVSPIWIFAVEYPLGTEFIANSLAVAVSFKLQCSIARIAVIIFVVLAGYFFSYPLFSYITFPVEASISNTASDERFFSNSSVFSANTVARVDEKVLHKIIAKIII